MKYIVKKVQIIKILNKANEQTININTIKRKSLLINRIKYLCII